MTVQNSKSIIIHQTDGIQLIFDYDFLVLDEDHLFLVDNSGLITTGFTIQGIGDENGGTVTFDPTAPDNGPLAIARFVPMTQLVDYQPFDAFPAATHETALDLQAMASQQLAVALGALTPGFGGGRVWQYSLNVEGAPNIVPAPIAGELRAIVFNEDEIAIGPTTSEIANAEASAQEALAQANRAESEADRAQGIADAGVNVIVGGTPIPTLVEAKLYVNNETLALFFEYNDGFSLQTVEVAATVPKSVPGAPPPQEPSVFVGSIMPWAGLIADIPNNYALCDGAEFDRITFAALFSVLNILWGEGDGANTFNLPDLRGRAVIGAGPGGALTERVEGEVGGEEEHTLITAEMPNHTHTYSDNPGGWTQGQNDGGSINHGNSNIQTGATGGGGSHNNMQPFAGAAYMIKVS